jgi:hypothetical protein
MPLVTLTARAGKSSSLKSAILDASRTDRIRRFDVAD